MTTVELNQVRSAATQAMFTAQYIASVHGDARYLETIKKYFLATESGLQPMVKTIASEVISGRDSLAQQVFSYCRGEYDRNTNLINAWMRSL